MTTLAERLINDSLIPRTADLGTKVQNLITLANELRTDHATGKTTVDETKTLVDELHDDHATFRTVVGDLKALVNGLRTMILYQGLGNPGFAIDTNFDVKNANAITYLNGGTLKSLSANTSFDTGTAATFPQGQWGVALLSVDSSGTAVVTWETAAGAGYADEATAIAAMPAVPAGNTPLGYVTVQAHAANSFTAGTDALTTGTGGNVAAATNYYNTSNANAEVVGAAVSSSAPAALSASKPTAGPATITAAAVTAL